MIEVKIFTSSSALAISRLTSRSVSGECLSKRSQYFVSRASFLAIESLEAKSFRLWPATEIDDIQSELEALLLHHVVCQR